MGGVEGHRATGLRARLDEEPSHALPVDLGVYPSGRGSAVPGALEAVGGEGN
jgi:hypothetical protein